MFINERWYQPAKVCVRCVMASTDPSIRFNEQGFCNLCTDFLENRINYTAYRNKNITATLAEKSALDCLWDKIISSRKSMDRYDCVIGISGGVDSSYTAVLAHRAGLRVLLVHLDNGWDTPTSLRNVKNLVDKLGFDYESAVLNWNTFKKIQCAFMRAEVPEIETPTDIAIQAVIHRAAIKHGIRWILSGGNISGEGILPKPWFYNARDSIYSNDILINSGVNLRNFDEIRFGFWSEFYARIFCRVKTVYPLNMIQYKKDNAAAILKREVNWLSYGGKHSESTFTRFAQYIYMPVKHGIDYRRAHFSTEICLGLTSRDDALLSLDEPPYAGINLIGDLSFVATKLGFSVDELIYIINSPPKWYFDFKNNEKMLAFSYSIYRFLTGKRKASNF